MIPPTPSSSSTHRPTIVLPYCSTELLLIQSSAAHTFACWGLTAVVKCHYVTYSQGERGLALLQREFVVFFSLAQLGTVKLVMKNPQWIPHTPLWRAGTGRWGVGEVVAKFNNLSKSIFSIHRWKVDGQWHTVC